MRRILCLLGLSLVLLGTIGCGRSGDEVEKLTPEQEAAKAKEQQDAQRKGMMEGYQKSGAPTPQTGGDSK